MKKEKTIFNNFGPALLILALGIGSGEFILWPFLTANYGYGVMWGALLGISLQLFLINIISRNTLIFKENIIEIFTKVFSMSFLWIVFSTFIGFGWPGFSSLTSNLMVNGFGLKFFGEQTFLILSIFILIFSGSILVFSKNAYKKILFLEKIMMSLLFILVIFLFIYYFNVQDFKDILLGFVGIGNGYNFIPNNIELTTFLATFLGAIAYAGSGGNLILGNSFFVMRENNISSEKLENKDTKNGDNDIKVRDKIKNIFTQNLVFFWFGGLIIISMLSYVSAVVLKNIDGKLLNSDFNFLILESKIFTEDINMFIGKLFIFLGVFALFGVQLGILDFIGRMAKGWFRSMKLAKKEFKNKILISLDEKKVYKIVISFTVVIGLIILMLGFDKPKSLITLGAVINAFSMGVIAVLLLLVEKKILPKKNKSKKVYISLLLTAVFYFSFFAYVVFDKIF